MPSSTMKVRIISSCTGDKLFSPANQLSKADFDRIDSSTLAKREKELSDYKLPAAELYTGQQHLRLMRGIEYLHESTVDVEIETWIVSAGYGLISEKHEIVPYECTFQTMKSREIDSWSKKLGIPNAARSLFTEPADLVLVLLGSSYLRALQLDETVRFRAPTYFFVASSKTNQIKGSGDVHIVSLNKKDAKRFQCGLVGLKGEIARRILAGLADSDLSLYEKIREPGTDILNLLDHPGLEPKITISPVTMGRTNPHIDYVINIPDEWWKKPHRHKLSYFIPDWDDTVDPDYDFETDTHSGGTGNWSNQVYAHQLYNSPQYDGLLVSKAVIEKNKTKRQIVNEMGIHRYLRVPDRFPVMGDCGAFSYVGDSVPPYQTNEILDYYTQLGFNYGVSIDHLLFGGNSPEEERERYQLTIHNAEEFLLEHHKRKLSWEPIGAVQGWDPKTYADAAQQYVKMGYKYIGLGGLVRSSTNQILSIADAVNQVIPDDVNVHLFGIARTAGLRTFIDLGITSIDSASYLRKAWMSINRSYLTEDNSYTTIRIPDAERVIRKKQKKKEEFDSSYIRALESKALKSIRALAKQECSVDTCLEVLLEYDEISRRNRRKSLDSLAKLYRRTLVDRPWASCGCAICCDVGVEVAIFRGNNRNRRRGFHNTHIFYKVMQQILNGKSVSNEWLPENQRPYQKAIFTFLRQNDD